MDHHKELRVKPGSKLHLGDFDPAYNEGTKEQAEAKIAKLQQKIATLQFQLYADQGHSLLICLQGMDASGKDGVVRHVFGSMNPQGCRVVSFKQPSKQELSHDFLWRIEAHTPAHGEAVIFNRSHYEDVLVVRVHDLVPKHVWQRRYDEINAFEQRLAENGTHIVKFFLHISKEEQLERFKQRLDDPARRWKISEQDYAEREYWKDYRHAYEDALSRCSTDHAPWYVIPANRKWFRNLAISEILLATMEGMGITEPEPSVDLAKIRHEYHQATQKHEKPKAKLG